ncbi:MAG: type II secretion system protein [Phycisphaerae bacterium]|nr:type II secretion system protein [Phycisphaerae bacterium]NUQ49933.1 type II secretion system protein [Phycisphaerae bacterium]
MPELLVVIGILALLIAIAVPPLLSARRQAVQTQCGAQLQSLGQSLEHARTEYRFYPFWDDGGAPTRFTWIDLLTQRRYLQTAGSPNGAPGIRRPMQDGVRIGYCPADLMPDPLNEVRHPNLAYPLDRNRRGVDYSYGIGAPLSAGGWAWRPGGNDARSRRFRDYDRNTAGRVLAADAYASVIYNLSGAALTSGIWNEPTQYDNTVAWGRHGLVSDGFAANILFQDGHVQTVSYRLRNAVPVNTAQDFVWRPGEPLTVNPDDEHEGQYYPSVAPPSAMSNPPGDVFPREMSPAWHTANREWTRITHK